MKGRFKLLLPAILFCVSSLCYAEVSDNSLNKILDLSGLTKQVGQFPGLIKMGMEQAKQQGAPIPDEDHKSMLMIVDQSVVTSEIVAEIRASLKESINEVEAKQLLTWYESELGKEITAAEERASTPEAYQEMMQSAESLMGDLERLEYAMRLDMSLGLTRMTMDLQEQTGLAVYSAIMTAIQPDKPLDLEPIKTKMKAERAQTRETIKQMVLISLAYSHKELAIDKLKKYETFLKDPITKKFIQTSMKSMKQALKTSASKIMKALVLMIKSKKQNSK